MYFKYNKVSLQALIQKLIKGVAGLGFKLDLSYIVSITIAAEFKDMKWEVWQNVGLACLVCKSMLLLRGSGERVSGPTCCNSICYSFITNFYITIFHTYINYVTKYTLHIVAAYIHSYTHE